MKLYFSLVTLAIAINLSFAQKTERINQTLEEWHKAAAEANFDTYTSLMTEDCVFIGTDATENWRGKVFLEFAKPYFERGKAWSFSTLERNIYDKPYENIAWFDELLNTQMGICRGSGVVVFEDNRWKVKHYVLSIAIPNENVEEVTILKKEFDTSFINSLKE
jgi:hypothetical protein